MVDEQVDAILQFVRQILGTVGVAAARRVARRSGQEMAVSQCPVDESLQKASRLQEDRDGTRLAGLVANVFGQRPPQRAVRVEVGDDGNRRPTHLFAEPNEQLLADAWTKFMEDRNVSGHDARVRRGPALQLVHPAN